jgi:hypothetical protein
MPSVTHQLLEATSLALAMPTMTMMETKTTFSAHLQVHLVSLKLQRSTATSKKRRKSQTQLLHHQLCLISY